MRLFAILLQKELGYRHRTPEEELGPEELSEITVKAGGEILTTAQRLGDRVALSADSEGKLKTTETLARLYEALLEDSLLEVELPFSIRKNEHWELSFSDAARRRWEGAHITYTNMLTGCN